jgi:hypothetical protein
MPPHASPTGVADTFRAANRDRLQEIRRAYHATSDPETQRRLRREAETVLAEQFADRRRRAEERLRWIREETGRIERSLAEMTSRRDQIIRSQLSSLLARPE